MSTEFPLIWPEIRLGDFCSCELYTEQTHQRVRQRGPWQINFRFGEFRTQVIGLSPNQKQTRSHWHVPCGGRVDHRSQRHEFLTPLHELS